jgi:TATA-box binding protein (TBP) (component of TFIID and TFIIIB)
MDNFENADEFLRLSSHAVNNDHSINIFTITMICKLNVPVNISKLGDNIVEPGIHVRKSSDRTQFHNQLTLSFNDISKKSIKIFANGTLHITGPSSYVECSDICSRVLKWIIKYDVTVTSDVHIITQYIPMMNARVITYKPINLVELCGRLRCLTDVICLYNPDTYPGLNVKILSRRISILIFRTGVMVITGCKRMYDVRYAYDLITVILKNTSAPDEILSSRRQVVRPAANIDTMIHGYPLKMILPGLFRDKITI